MPGVQGRSPVAPPLDDLSNKRVLTFYQRWGFFETCIKPNAAGTSVAVGKELVPSPGAGMPPHVASPVPGSGPVGGTANTPES